MARTNSEHSDPTSSNTLLRTFTSVPNNKLLEKNGQKGQTRSSSKSSFVKKDKKSKELNDQILKSNKMKDMGRQATEKPPNRLDSMATGASKKAAE